MNTAGNSTDQDKSIQLDFLIVDCQGVLRGKRVPAAIRKKILSGEARMPLSTQMLDIFGDDNDAITGLGLSVGDPDGICIPGPHDDGFHNQPWNPHHEQILCTLHNLDGTPSEFDVRAILQRAVDKLRAVNLHPVVAVELEFYLMDAQTRTTGKPTVPDRLNVALCPNDLQIYDMRAMDRVSDVLQLIHEYANAMGIPAETSLAEYGPGQFEINLKHQSDPVRAADHAILFKQLVDRAAFEKGLIASFMAKPYTEHGGCGQHVHVSLLDENGRNVFDAKSDTPDLLLQAVAGCLDNMEACLLILAPNANSYRRLQPESFAPVRVDWGYDHRGVAVRLPETEGPGARLEHRVAGADANPYLVLATLLGCISTGLENAHKPDTSPLLPGEQPTGKNLTHDWLTAIDKFEQSDWIKEVLGARFCTLYARIKRYEAQQFNRQVSDIDLATYLSRI